MAEINKEIGLEDLLRGLGMQKSTSHGEASSSDGGKISHQQTEDIEHAKPKS